MIGSFWNFCRACPSMPVDKLHSEYRSTYRWHEYTGPRQEVVRWPPQSTNQMTSSIGLESKPAENGNPVRMDEPSNELPKLEPALPRRKKHPDLAYKHHEFMAAPVPSSGTAMDPGSRDIHATVAADRPRVRETSLLRKAISKINTEYRLQFAWPAVGVSQREAAGGGSSSSAAPRKSKSMGALKQPAQALVHRKRTDFENKDASELEPLVNDHTIREEDGVLKKGLDTEYNKNFRPFSQYEYSNGRFKAKVNQDEAMQEITNKIVNGAHCQNGKDWYREVVELRRKAGEYKNRGWSSKVSSEKVAEIAKKHEEIWEQVSKRSSLSALSLASTTHKVYSKEEKEQENTKKSSPMKSLRNLENTARMKDMLRHHLERTTGVSEFDGLILSPTRDKLEPTIPRRDEDSRGSQKSSPKKNSPQKLSLQKKNSQKNKKNVRTARSQSVGPVEISTEKRSPKRQSRSATVKEKRVSSTQPGITSAPIQKRPRPSSLNTTVSSRSKNSCSIPPKVEDRLLPRPNKQSVTSKYAARGRPVTLGENVEHNMNAICKYEPTAGDAVDQQQDDGDENDDNGAASITAPAAVASSDFEPMVKSPPEPTRVKSPEQIMMRSPDPVNWTVPLDTGKTFTVTQNIRGTDDFGNRPHSEVKTHSIGSLPPSADDILHYQRKE